MKLFKFDSDASTFEKVATYVGVLFLAVVLFLLFGSVWGLFTNDLSRSAATASAGYHTLGTIFLLLAIGVFISGVLDLQISENLKVSASVRWLIIFVLLNLSVLSYCGFFVGVY